MAPKSQKAWMVVGRGDPSKVLQLQTDVPVLDELQSGECLVKIVAAALNPIGYKLIKYAPNFMLRRPFIAEQDISGIVISQKDTEFKEGDEVFGWTFNLGTKEGRQGALSQYVRIPSSYLTAKPAHISFQEASGIAMTGLTSYRLLIEIAQVKSGQTIFVNGGGTSCGRQAIEIGKAIGCKVVATCSTRSLERVKEYGADEVIDYTVAPVYEQLAANPPTTKFDVIFECYGDPSPLLYARSKPYLSPSGMFISVGPQPSSFKDFMSVFRLVFEGFMRPAWLGGVKAKFVIFSNQSNKKEDLDALSQMVSEGKIKPVVDSVFEFKDALKAFERIMTGKAVGKVVVNIDHEDS